MKTRFLMAVALAWTLWVSPSWACDRYYLLVFGSQRVPPNPQYSHSFAVFVKVSGPPEAQVLECVTISWLPETGDVRLWTLLPEKGRNYELHETIHWALSSCQRISLFGPYEIKKSLYDKAVRQRYLLEKWRTKYKAVDSGYPTFLVTNCIHAISDVAGVNRLRVASPSWGETASYLLLRRFTWWIIDKRTTHDWLIPALALDQYPIVLRDFKPPRTGALWSLLLGPR